MIQYSKQISHTGLANSYFDLLSVFISINGLQWPVNMYKQQKQHNICLTTSKLKKR